MTEEEKNAIEKSELSLKIVKDSKIKGRVFYDVSDLEVLLNLIQKQDTEINKLNNVIDRMAEVLNDFDYDKQCENCRTDICSASVDGTEYTHCIKEYFMKEDK